MAIVRFISLVLLLALGQVAIAAASGSQQIYVMRHLQKAEGDDPPLSAAGAANAQRLAGWFGANPPAAIYVSSTRRARETAAPLAARLGLTAREYDPRDSKALVAAVGKEAGNVLIVGHSNTVPDIIELLGAGRIAPIGDDQFGSIWSVSSGSGGSRQLKQYDLAKPGP